MFTQGSVTVVTAATGHRHLLRCLQSVQRQTYQNLEHFVVVDGQERLAQVQEVVARLSQRDKRLHVVELPNPTGKDRWCGHRIYGAFSFLVNSEFVSFLDEDNWFEPDHIETLVTPVLASQAQWAFSLRNIVDEDGAFITRDESECLGNLHTVYYKPGISHVDTNCYLLRREVAVHFAPVWYRPGRPPNGQWEADYLMCKLLLEQCPKVCSNRKHTVNYTIASRVDSPIAGYFLRGNQQMRALYPQGLPWERPLG